MRGHGTISLGHVVIRIGLRLLLRTDYGARYVQPWIHSGEPPRDHHSDNETTASHEHFITPVLRCMSEYVNISDFAIFLWFMSSDFYYCSARITHSSEGDAVSMDRQCGHILRCFY